LRDLLSQILPFNGLIAGMDKYRRMRDRDNPYRSPENTVKPTVAPQQDNREYAPKAVRVIATVALVPVFAIAFGLVALVLVWILATAIQVLRVNSGLLFS